MIILKSEASGGILLRASLYGSELAHTSGDFFYFFNA